MPSEGMPRWSPVDRARRTPPDSGSNRPPMGERRVPPRLRAQQQEQSAPPPTERRTPRAGGRVYERPQRQAPSPSERVRPTSEVRGNRFERPQPSRQEVQRAQQEALQQQEARDRKAELLRTQIGQLDDRIQETQRQITRMKRESLNIQSKEAVVTALQRSHEQLNKQLAELGI